MLTLLFGALVFAALWHLVARKPWAAIAGGFLLFSLVTRTIAVGYLDFAGPVYAVELNDDVGGGGASMPLFALSMLAFMLPLAALFNKRAIATWLPSIATAPKAAFLSNVALVVIASFIAALYADMLFRGTIPLFSGMDRLEYAREVAGPLHAIAYEFSFLWGFAIGMFFVYGRLHGGDFDLRFGTLALVYLLYQALTGNRFSVFYAFAGYFVIPLGAVPALRSIGALRPPPSGRGQVLRMVTSRAALPIALIMAALILSGLVINSLVNVRAYDDPAEQLSQRVLIQPVELWWTTWNSLSTSRGELSDTWYSTFIKPIDPSRNTSIQILMVKNLGDERAEELIELGQQYAGGYPEILFELLGAWAALPVALAFGIVTSALLRLCVGSVCRGHIFTALLALYVCFGFSLLYIGGMLNFLIAWTFGVKLVALLVAALLERGATRRRQRRALHFARATPAMA